MRSLALCGTLAAALVAPPGPPPRPAPVRAVLDEPKATITAQAVKPRGATKAWEVHKFGGASLATPRLRMTKQWSGGPSSASSSCRQPTRP